MTVVGAERARPAGYALGIFGVALLVRLVHVWQIRRSPFFSLLMGDSRGYDEWAQRIAGGEWLGRDVFYQAPLYPYLLGVIYAIAGRDLLVVRVVQALIGSASCALLALAAARLFPRSGRNAGIAAGLMLALYAPAIFFDGLLQKSVLDVFFVCLALYLISDPEKTAEHAENAKKTFSPRSLRSPRLLLYVGLTMGGLALTRENALVFIVVIVVWIVAQGLGARGWGLAGRWAGMFLVGLAIVLVPVAARNAYVGGGFYITTSQFGPNFYIGNNPAADGTYQSLRFGRGAPEYERQDATELAERALGKRLTPAEVSGYWTGKALDFVTSRPTAWLALTGRKIALLWNATEMLDTESQEAHAEWSLPLQLGGFVGHFGVLVPLALFGVVMTWPMRSRLWILYAMTMSYSASIVLFYVFARYRYPLVPLLILFAAAGMSEVHELIVARGFSPAVAGLKARATPWWTLATVAAVAVFCNWPMLSSDLMRAVTENNLAVALQAEQRYDEAMTHYERAMALRPDYAPAYNNLGTALRAQGRTGDAVAAYERALRLRPDYPGAHYNMANALSDAGKPDAAIDHFQIALRSEPASVETHNNLGIALAARGRADQALAEFQAALAIDPNSAKSHRNLGDLLASSGRTNEAIDHLRRATELAPGDGALHYDVGSVLLDAGRPADAAVEFRAALEATPNSVEAHNNLGIALGSQGKLDEAIGEFEEALRLQPGFEQGRQNLAMALEARRRK